MSKRAEYQRAWREKNKAKVLAYHAEYRLKNREKRRQWNNEWIEFHREQYNASKYSYRDRLKLEALRHYSAGEPLCSFCGVTDIDCLCLDHIQNNGAAHRKELGVGSRSSNGVNMYAAVKREGFPVGLQVLCANCNMKKEIVRKRQKRMNNAYYKELVGATENRTVTA